MTQAPQAARPCSPLRNGNRQGDWNNAPNCGAKTRKGTPCRSAAMKNGRCRMHGGKSTGPRTAAGIERIRASRTKHGRYSQASIARRREAREAIRTLRALLKVDPTADVEGDHIMEALARL
jgi:hypothetical protein